MEILSTGEKIKKSRVYKGLTLKELCGDKISVSKMSCIENNKIKPDLWVLEFTSNKLNIDYNYLKKDVEDHLKENLELIETYPLDMEGYEKKLKYNLEYSQDYNYPQISMKIMHLLFQYYLNNNDIQSLEELQCTYYDIYQKAYSIENQEIYYMDMANYLYMSKEYVQAANYYDNVIKSITSREDCNVEYYTLLVKAIYKESYCYVKQKDYEKAYELAMKISDYMEHIDDQLLKANCYHMMAFLCLRMNDDRFLAYEKKSLRLYKEKHFDKVKAFNEYADIMIELGLMSEGMEYIEKALKVCPDEPKERVVEYKLMLTETLIKGNFITKAEEINSEILNIAIELNNLIFIEKAYHNKSIICMMQDNDYSAEMYMNLSLDALVKFGTKKQLYNRYLELGKMYYKFNNTMEALKYFNLAIKMEKYI
ncbi:helix-turn-helix domain-containing protein [Hathewaya histolytica]|uniref:helix-turn-helix domain-containing protein n=1 Tax=Hathewaya histolytica TaxID=1498 RepID=UPI003B680A28